MQLHAIAEIQTETEWWWGVSCLEAVSTSLWSMSRRG